MTNFDTARDALETSLNSSGSAMKEHAKWSESLEARLNKLQSAWQGLSQAFLSSDFLKGALDAVIGLVDGLTKLIDTLGVLPTLVTAFVAAKSFTKGGGGFFKVIEDDATGAAKRITTTFGKAAAESRAALRTIGLKTDSAFKDSLEADKIALNNWTQELEKGTPAAHTFESIFNGASAAARDFANSGKLATEGISGFIKQQQLAQVSVQAQNKSLANSNVLIREYYAGYKVTGLKQKDFADAVAKTNPQLAAAMRNSNGAKQAMRKYTTSLIAAKASTIALRVGTALLNATLTMGISLLADFVLSGVMKLINADKELAEQVEELTSKFKEQHEELQKLRGDYDTSNESSMISKYAKLSKGVDGLGRNVSLTAEEYSEYQSIVNQIADQIPSLVSGYDSQGNAILSCKDDVNELTAAYEKLIHIQNQEILTNTGNIEKDFANTIDSASGKGWDSKHGFWTGLLGGLGLQGLTDLELKGDTAQSLKDLLDPANAKNKDAILKKLSGNKYAKEEIRDALKDAGVEIKWWQSNPIDVLKETLETNPEKIKGIVDKYYGQFTEAVDEQKTIALAKLSEAFDIRSDISGLDYSNIGEDLQAVAYRVVNSLDLDFFTELQNQGKSVEEWVSEMLNQLNSLSNSDGAKIEAAFDLQARFNDGEISYGEYVKGLEDTGKLIDGLGLKPELASKLKLSLGLDEDGLIEEYHNLKNRLADKDLFNIAPSEYESFLKSLSAEELAILIDIIPELSGTAYKETIADIKAALEREMMLQGLTFNLNIEVETAGLEALNTALSESVSATGLSSESITALKGRYADLESQGYDLSSMFEETSTGIRLNRQEFNKLEKAYATQKLAKVDGELNEMKAAYDDLGEAIKNCDDPIKKSELFNDRQTLAKRISEAATLASEYKGLTSAYNDWLSAEEAGQERDMYENVIKGWETIDDEISRGWIDDSAIEFLELLTGRTDLAGKSGKQLKEIYDGLDDTIKNTGYSIRDFFTVDEDGNSTNTGVYNFLDAIGQLEEEKFGGKDVVKRDKDGNIIGFNFKVAGGDEAIAEALGISEELVQIMVRAADDAGFVISMDGTYKQLADLQNEARAAANYLQEIGKTDFAFDFNTSSVESLKTQLEEAKAIWENEDFWNKDGTFNFNADGATQAMQVISTLQAKLDKLTEEQYGIGLTVEEEEFKKPLENLQEYGRTVQTLNQLKLNPEVNAEEIEKLEGNLDEIAKYFAGLDGDLKVDLGLDADDTWEEVKTKIETGEVKIPATLDIQANMDKNIERLADLAWLNSGFLSENEQETIRKRYNIIIEGQNSYVDPDIEQVLTTDQAARKQKVEIIAKTMGIKDVKKLSKELKGLDDKTIKAIAEAVGKGDVDALEEAVSGLDDKTVQAIAKALGYSDVDALKTAVSNLDGKEVDVEANTDGQEEKISKFQSWIDGLRGKSVVIDFVVSGIEKIKEWLGIGGANGTANVDGTAFVNGTTGRAYKQGNWATKNSGTALMGELGREIIVRDGRWFTVGDTGAGFYQYKKGDIIFNHKQSEELLKNGKVTSGGGRAKAFAQGTALSLGSGGIGAVTVSLKDDSGGSGASKTKVEVTTNSSSGSQATTGGTNKVEGSAIGTQNKFKEIFDWITIAIERLERTIDNFDKTVNDVSKSWTQRNQASTDEINAVRGLITDIGSKDDSNSLAGKYWDKAHTIFGEDSDVAKKIRGEVESGTFSIDLYEDENGEAELEKIKEYQKWYELYLDIIDKAADAKQTEAELWAQRFDNIIAQYDGILQGFEHTENMLDEYISQAETKGHIVSKRYYAELIKNTKNNVIPTLKGQQSALLDARQDYINAMLEQGMSLEDIYNSEQYKNMCAEIDGVTQEIEAATTQTIEWSNAIRDIDWQVFDLIQGRIADTISEADFLIELMSSDKLFSDDGKMTDKGLATMGLYGQKYNTYMYQADDYGAKINEIDNKILTGELDGYDDAVIEKRREYVELQREAILNAEQEKQAIKDLVEEGINLELEALQERIDLHNEELDSMKNLYDYQKNVQKQTEEIAALEKQRAAYLNDDSEESKAKLQEITVSLRDAKENLQETEYDRYISDQSKLLDSLYEEYELILNQRLDNVDALLSDMITGINDNATIISSTLSTEVSNVGATLSDTMKGIWENEGAAKTVIAEYGAKFQAEQTTTNLALGAIKSDVNKMVSVIDKDANKNVGNGKTDTSANADPTGNGAGNRTRPDKQKKKVITDDILKGIAAAIWIYGSDAGWGDNPFRENKLTDKIGANNAKKVQNIINSQGNSGGLYDYWVKSGKSNLSQFRYAAFATGARKIDEAQLAWTQENGQEFIVRPSDGAILTPIAKGDSVLTSAASSNIWSMANSPTEFIKDNLRLDTANVPNNSTVQNSYVQNFENITFSMPNVHGYSELLKEMQKDPKFEKLILSMTIDQITGKSSLSKGKSIR